MSKQTPCKKDMKAARERRMWTAEKKDAIKRQLSHYLVFNKVPQKHEAEKARACEPELKNRSWRDIKYYVYNQLKKTK